MMRDMQEVERLCRDAADEGVLHGVALVAGTGKTPGIQWSWGRAAVEPTVRPMRDDAIFDLASVTKVVATASACAVCIDRGLLDANAPARDYLPELGEVEPGAIRVRDLATHCSGYDNRKFDHEAPEDILTQLVEAPARWPAGRVHQYSCRNYILLGLIVEAVTGQQLAEFCRDALFGPLGMKHTCFGPLTEGLERVVPTVQPAGVISDEQARKAPRSVGNAGLFSCIGDLSKYCRMVLQAGVFDGRHIIGMSGLGWMTHPCSPEGLPRWSFGWDMQPHPASLHRPKSLSASAIGHSGWTGQSIWIDPDRDAYIVILTNRTHARNPSLPDNYDASKQFRSDLADLVLSHFCLLQHPAQETP